MIEFILIRHGETEGNAKKQYIGKTDMPLSPEGEEKARQSPVDYDITSVYVSPMLRARQTSSIKFPNAEQIIRDGLREMDFGVFEERSPDDMRGDSEYAAWLESHCLGRCPGGESFEEFNGRVLAAFNEIVADCVSENRRQAVIVAHGGTIMSIMHEHAPERKNFYEWPVSNCCGYSAKIDEETWGKKPQFLSYNSI